MNKPFEFENLLNLVLNHKPKFFYGYTNAVYLFAKFLEERNIKLDFVSGVFTTAENLQDYQRLRIEERIGKVYDHYGCSEINGIAVQTTFDRYYSLIEPKVYVELEPLDDNLQSSKKLLVTDFYNKVLPFIRYENGDLATEFDENSKINSFLKYSKLTSIDGRMSDIINLPSGGSLVVPSFLGSGLLNDIEGVKQYQVIKNDDVISVNLLCEKEINPEVKSKILKKINSYLRNEFKVELVFNKEIIKSNNGKFKLFVDASNYNLKTKNHSDVPEKEI